MKIKKSILIVAMVLISLFAIGAVSAAEDVNVTDDAGDLATIENDVDVDEIVAATGDENVLNDEGIENPIIYSISGQRQTILHKGINIVNGQKVVIK